MDDDMQWIPGDALSVITKLCRHIFCTMAVVLLTLSGAPASAQDTLSIHTASGNVAGASEEGVDSWLGLPYAAPPVGPLRWRPPAPPTAWTGTRISRTPPGQCAQNADLGLFARAGGSEDCLYLNVYRPAGVAADAKLPVMIWLHGGSLWVGQGLDYDPAKLVKNGPMVVVTINYRLGVFGYFAHPKIDSEGHLADNYGLMDQQAAMRWVQQNISAFGGNPGNVTLAGESSGGNSVLLHMVSPQAAGTFQHALAMSGGSIVLRHPAFGAPRPLKVAQDVGTAFAKAVGCEKGGPRCLRKLTTRQILDAQTPYLINQVILDGRLIPMHPSDAFRTGRFNRVTLVNGNNRDEGRFFAGLIENQTKKAMDEPAWRAMLDGYYGAQLASLVRSEYPLASYRSPAESYAAAVGDSLFACPGLLANNQISRHMPLYAYEFSDGTSPSYLDPTTFPLLAAHTHEIPYIFRGFKGGSQANVRLNLLQEQLSDSMIALFANLSELPNKQSDWPRYDPVRENVMTFVLPKPVTIEGRYALDHHCSFWDRAGIY